MTEIKLRLKWRKTWSDRENDFVGLDPRFRSETVGRIYVHDTGGFLKGQWFWTLTAHGKGIRRPIPASGYVSSAREAAKMVEDTWFGSIDDDPDARYG